MTTLLQAGGEKASPVFCLKKKFFYQCAVTKELSKYAQFIRTS